MDLGWNPYYLGNLFFTGCYVTLFLVYLSRFTSEEPRNDSFRRLLMASLSWAFFDLLIHLIGRTGSPQLAERLFVWLSFLFLFYPAAAGEMLLALIVPVNNRRRLFLYGPYLVIYLVGLAFPQGLSAELLGAPSPDRGFPWWNLLFKGYTFIFTGGMLLALFLSARRQPDALARREGLILLAGGTATWGGIVTSQLLKTFLGPEVPWMANAATCFTALAAFLGIRRYGRVFSARSLYEATVLVVPSGLAHFRGGAHNLGQSGPGRAHGALRARGPRGVVRH